MERQALGRAPLLLESTATLYRPSSITARSSVVMQVVAPVHEPHGLDRLVPDVGQAVGRGRVERDRLARTDLVGLEAEGDLQPAPHHVAVLDTRVPGEALVQGGAATDV